MIQRSIGRHLCRGDFDKLTRIFRKLEGNLEHFFIYCPDGVMQNC